MKKVITFTCIFSIIVTYVFGDTIKYTKKRFLREQEQVEIEESGVKFLGVKEEKLYYSKPYGFLGNRWYSIDCYNVIQIIDDHNNEISFNCEVDTFKGNDNNKDSFPIKSKELGYVLIMFAGFTGILSKIDEQPKNGVDIEKYNDWKDRQDNYGWIIWSFFIIAGILLLIENTEMDQNSPEEITVENTSEQSDENEKE